MKHPHDERIRFDRKELELIKKGDKILAVCSEGNKNLDYFKEEGFDITGLESKDVFDKKFPFKDNSFNFVYSYQFLNHNYKEEIVEVCKEIFRVLKKGGLFAIKITNIEKLYFKHIKNDIYQEINPLFAPMQYKVIANQTIIKLSGEEKHIPHYAFYEEELVEMLESIGFKLITIRKEGWNLVGNFIK